MGCFMPNNGKGTQANKLESDKILEKYINAYDGNKTSWALFVFKETGLRSPSAWRKVLERYVQMNPDKEIEVDTGHDLLPNVWDGTLAAALLTAISYSVLVGKKAAPSLPKYDSVYSLKAFCKFVLNLSIILIIFYHPIVHLV